MYRFSEILDADGEVRCLILHMMVSLDSRTGSRNSGKSRNLEFEEPG